MIDLPDLRPYQVDFVSDLRKAIQRKPRVIACSPTGSGKSTVAKWIIGSSILKNDREGYSGRSLFTVHRRGLVDNAIDTFNLGPV